MVSLVCFETDSDGSGDTYVMSSVFFMSNLVAMQNSIDALPWTYDV